MQFIDPTSDPLTPTSAIWNLTFHPWPWSEHWCWNWTRTQILKIGTLWTKSDHSAGVNRHRHTLCSSPWAALGSRSMCCLSCKEVRTSVSHQANWLNYCVYRTSIPWYLLCSKNKIIYFSNNLSPLLPNYCMVDLFPHFCLIKGCMGYEALPLSCIFLIMIFNHSDARGKGPLWCSQFSVMF